MLPDSEFYAAVSSFITVQRVAHDTRQALAEGLHAPGEPVRARRHAALNSASAFLGDAREGFALSLRTRPSYARSELRYLINRFWMNWQWLDELGVQVLPPDQIERVRAQLISFWMASVALGMLPQMPTEQVTFPASGYHLVHYADIPAPRSPAELLSRLEEIEQVMRHVQIRPLAAVEPEKMRRAYGFFDASAWLTDQHLARFNGTENPG